MRKFDSEFCNVKYIEEDNVVLLTWKKFCSYDNYRNPVIFAVDLMKETGCNKFVCDARNGFEDEKDDVEWGFNVFLPSLAKTSCKKIVFIMEKVNEIEEEMDMWTKEFSKYFEVYRVENYEKALKR